MSYAFTSEGVIVTGKPDAKGMAKSETILYVPMPTGASRVKAVQKAIEADASASEVAVSYFLEAATTSGDILAFAGYATVRDAEDRLTLTLKPESEELKKSRSAFNKSTRESLAPIVKADLTAAHPKKGAQWVAEEWSAMLAQGSFAMAISACRKYVAFTGKLPCAYSDNGAPDISRGLSVYAMQQVCKQYAAQDVAVGFADKVRKLFAEWKESKDRGDVSDRAACFHELNEFCMAVETDYLMESQKTTAAHMGLNGPNVGEDLQASVVELEEQE